MTPFVGRAAELDQLARCWSIVRSERGPHLVVIRGRAGLGRTRLVREFLRSVPDALVVRGEPSAFTAGFGIEALSEIVLRLSGIDRDDPRAATGRLSELLGLAVDSWQVRALADVIGASDDPRELPELYSGVRRLFEAVGRSTPVVIVVDDLDGCGRAVVNTIEYMVPRIQAAPVLVICTANEAFAQLLPEKDRSRLVTSMQLSPLSDDLVEAMLHASEQAAPAEIARASKGSPLFLEHAARFLSEGGDPASVPSSTEALVGLRLELLDEAARSALGHASILEKDLSRDALLEVMGADRSLDDHLPELHRSGYLLPAPKGSFTHPVVRQVAYDSLAPSFRAQAHERVARRLARLRSLGTHDELIAVHLALAGDDADIRNEASARFVRAGTTRSGRADMPAAVDLFERVAEPAPPGDRLRLTALLGSCEPLLALERPDEVAAIARRGLDEASTAGDTSVAARFRFWDVMLGPDMGLDSTLRVLDNLARTFERNSESAGLAQVLEVFTQMAWQQGDPQTAYANASRALENAKTSTDKEATTRLAAWLCSALVSGPMPATQAIEVCEGLRWIGSVSAVAEVKRSMTSAALHAMSGDVERARRGSESAREIQRDLGQPPWIARIPQTMALIELWDGRPHEVEGLVGPDLDQLLKLGHPAGIDSGVLLARAWCEQGRYDDAEALVGRCERALGGSGPESGETMAAEVAAVGARSKAGVGKLEEADLRFGVASVLEEERVEIVPCAEALLDLGEAAITLRDEHKASVFLNAALGSFRRKGHVPSIDRCNRSLSKLQPN